jgi:hypothetical protein
LTEQARTYIKTGIRPTSHYYQCKGGHTNPHHPTTLTATKQHSTLKKVVHSVNEDKIQPNLTIAETEEPLDNINVTDNTTPIDIHDDTTADVGTKHMDIEIELDNNNVEASACLNYIDSVSNANN